MVLTSVTLPARDGAQAWAQPQGPGPQGGGSVPFQLGGGLPRKESTGGSTVSSLPSPPQVRARKQKLRESTRNWPISALNSKVGWSPGSQGGGGWEPRLLGLREKGLETGVLET